MHASTTAFQQLALPASRISSQTLATLRARLTALTFSSPYLSEVEKLQANHRIHECEDAQQLSRWLTNTPNALARRQPVGSFPTPSAVSHVV